MYLGSALQTVGVAVLRLRRVTYDIARLPESAQRGTAIMRKLHRETQVRAGLGSQDVHFGSGNPAVEAFYHLPCDNNRVDKACIQAISKPPDAPRDCIELHLLPTAEGLQMDHKLLSRASVCVPVLLCILWHIGWRTASLVCVCVSLSLSLSLSLSVRVHGAVGGSCRGPAYEQTNTDGGFAQPRRQYLPASLSFSVSLFSLSPQSRP